ncbi:MAG: DUF1127 domain-containing protein [Proteobacteria bacterium]|nr:DUF1127 domain-containing protein [Pseudomonadota bacterium]
MAEIAMSDGMANRTYGHRAMAIGRVVRRLAVLGRRWRKAIRDRATLASMDGRTRRDIGVGPAEVRRAFHMPWWRWPLN